MARLGGGALVVVSLDLGGGNLDGGAEAIDREAKDGGLVAEAQIDLGGGELMAGEEGVEGGWPAGLRDFGVEGSLDLGGFGDGVTADAHLFEDEEAVDEAVAHGFEGGGRFVLGGAFEESGDAELLADGGGGDDFTADGGDDAIDDFSLSAAGEEEQEKEPFGDQRFGHQKVWPREKWNWKWLMRWMTRRPPPWMSWSRVPS